MDGCGWDGGGSVYKCYKWMTPKIELQPEIVDDFWQDSEYPSVNVLVFMVHYWVIFYFL